MSTVAPSLTFGTKVSNNEGGDYETPPSGMFPAVLVGLIDLGTTENTYQGKTSDRHKILFVWELTAEHDSHGSNFLVAQDYTWSLGKKAKLHGVVESFTGKVLNDGDEYDLGLMLGKPCVVSLTEGVSGNGKKFVEIASVTQPMRGLNVPNPTRPIVAFLLAQLGSTKDDLGIPDWIPVLYGRKVTDDIKKSKEYLALPPF